LASSEGGGATGGAPRAGFWQHQRALSLAIAAAAALFACAFVAQLEPPPNPRDDRDFSTLLLADTFRHARVANPVPDYARFIESPEVLISPHYMSAQPPLQGVLPWLGLLLGDPYRGTALGFALASAALVWMLRAHSSAGIALAAALSVALHAALAERLGLSLGPAGLLFLGAALVFGALPRLAAGGALAGAALGGGATLLASLDPLSAIWIAVFGAAALARGIRTPGGRRALGIAGGVALSGLAAHAAYNAATTGSAWTSPAALLAERQARVPELVIQSHVPDAAPVRPNPSFERAYGEKSAESKAYHRRQNWAGFVDGVAIKNWQQWTPLFGFSGIALCGLALFAWRRGGVGAALAGVASLALLSALRSRDDFAHMAGAVPLVALLCARALEALRGFRLRGLPAGALLAAYAVPIAVAEHTEALQNERLWSDGSPFDGRPAIVAHIEELSPRAVVFATYRSKLPPASEWVHNGADPDSQRILWLREGTAEENEALAARFGDREPWLGATDGGPLAAERHPKRMRWWFAREAEANPKLLELTELERRALERWYRGEHEKLPADEEPERIRKNVRMLNRIGALPQLAGLEGEELERALEANVAQRVENRRRRIKYKIQESRVTAEFAKRWDELSAQPESDAALSALPEDERRRVLLERVRQQVAEQAIDEQSARAALLARALAIYRGGG
jgi:hypothetical protein